jgi:drug/metabolite transporter (DMT)-like permease
MWLVFTVIFVISQIVFLQTFKYVSRTTKNAGSLCIVVQIVCAFSAVLIMPFYKWVFPTGWLVWVLLGIALVLYAINDRLDATTRKNLDITVDTMLQQVYRIFFLIGGIIFLSRPFVWLKFAGAVIIVLANMFLLFRRGHFQFNRFVALKILSAIIFAAAFTIDNYNSTEFNIGFYVFISFGVPAVFLLIARQSTFRGLYDEIRRPEWAVITICGIAQMIMTYAILRAYQYLDKFVEVAAISSVYVLLNVVFAVIFLRERDRLVQKFIAGAIIVGAIVMIAAV